MHHEKKTTVSVVNIKKQFSEYLNRTSFSDCRVIITKRNRPVAAIVSMKDLQVLEQSEKRRGLLSLRQKWNNFEEIEDDINDVIALRHEEGTGRDVSF